MKLTFINGSPRGKSSNSKIILDRFKEGFLSVESDYILEEIFLNKPGNHTNAARSLENSDIVILGFPLYTDSMPGIVKEFIEAINLDSLTNKSLKLGFIVQSGFPEAHHSVYIEKYLEKLVRRLDVNYLGTVIRGGVEGIKIQPRWMTRYLDIYYELGQHLALEMEFAENLINKLRKPEHLAGMQLILYKLLRATGLSNFYWNSQLKKNGAYAERYAQPYNES